MGRSVTYGLIDHGKIAPEKKMKILALYTFAFSYRSGY